MNRGGRWLSGCSSAEAGGAAILSDIANPKYIVYYYHAVDSVG